MKIGALVGITLVTILVQTLFPISSFIIILGLSICCFIFTLLHFKSKTPRRSAYRYTLQFMIPLLIIVSIISIRTLKPLSAKSPQTLTGRVVRITESKAQKRIVVQTPEKIWALGIYYKPKKKSIKNQNIFSLEGRILDLKTTKTQLQLTLSDSKKKVWAILYFSKKQPLPLFFKNLKVGDLASFLITKLTPLSEKPTYYKKKISQGFTHRASIKAILKINGRAIAQLKPLNKELILPNIQIGNEVEMTFRKEAVPIHFFTKPTYLFAQKIQYRGTIKELKVLNSVVTHSVFDRIKTHLSNFFNKSPFASFYSGIFLGIKRVDSSIEKLFFKNDVIAFLVISGLHINMVISFLVFFIIYSFFLFDLLSRKPNAFSILKQTKQLSQNLTSPYILIILSVVLLFYLHLLGYPQAASRAVFAFMILGLFSYFNIQSSYFSFLGLTLIVLLCLFPYWLAFPIGMFYSFVAMAGIYSTVPLTNHMKAKFKSSKVLFFILSQLLITCMVSLFIFPASLFYFHKYNFISILLNIPLSFLFLMIMYVGSFSILIQVLTQTLALLILKVSDFLIQSIIVLLNFSSQFRSMIIYVEESPPIWLICIYYTSLLLLMNAIRLKLGATNIKSG